MKIKPDNAFYKYVNVNPKQKHCGDCVVRAIALALGQTWEQTVRELTELGIKKSFVLNDPKLYPLYLKEKGFVECKEPRDKNNKKVSIRFWLMNECEDDKVYIINAGNKHVSCIVDRKVNDIWDCSSNTMHKYWIKS